MLSNGTVGQPPAASGRCSWSMSAKVHWSETKRTLSVDDLGAAFTTHTSRWMCPCHWRDYWSNDRCTLLDTKSPFGERKRLGSASTFLWSVHSSGSREVRDKRRRNTTPDGATEEESSDRSSISGCRSRSDGEYSSMWRNVATTAPVETGNLLNLNIICPLIHVCPF